MLGNKYCRKFLASPNKRLTVYDVAIDLNISHVHVISFLDRPDVNSPNSKITLYEYQFLILAHDEQSKSFKNSKKLKGRNKNNVIFKNVIKKYQSATGAFQVKYIESRIEKK